MKKKKVISYKDLPTKSPVSVIVLGWIAMDHWCAPSWLYGVLGTIGAILLLAWALSRFYLEDEVSLLKNDDK